MDERVIEETLSGAIMTRPPSTLKQSNYRLSPETIAQLKYLKKMYGTEAAAIREAVQTLYLYHKTIK